MSEKNENSTPPSNLSAEELADWWRKNGGGMNNIDTLSNLERICTYCGAANPCTGNDTCIQCEHSLEDALRSKYSTQHSPGSQHR